MDKGRAIIINAVTRMKESAGEAELMYCPKHIYWEARKLIDENGWANEAAEYYASCKEEAKAKLIPVKKEFLEYLKAGKKDNEVEEKLMREFQKFDINGIEEEKVRFQAKNGREPLEEEIAEIGKKRKTEDYENLKAFVEEQAKIYLGKEFNPEILTTAAQKLKERGLYNIALKNIRSAINNISMDDIEQLKDFPRSKYMLYS